MNRRHRGILKLEGQVKHLPKKRGKGGDTNGVKAKPGRAVAHAKRLACCCFWGEKRRPWELAECAVVAHLNQCAYRDTLSSIVVGRRRVERLGRGL